MKQSPIAARLHYETAYRLLRRSGGSMHLEDKTHIYSDAEDCALLSYDYHDSGFSGWINRTRMARFLQLKYPAHPDYGIPF